jgi:hypothetical protein
MASACNEFATRCFDPARCFSSPEAVLEEPALSAAEKIAVLRSWEHDARELLVADHEGMPGASDSLLQRIRIGIHRLSVGAALPLGVWARQSRPRTVHARRSPR